MYTAHTTSNTHDYMQGVCKYIQGTHTVHILYIHTYDCMYIICIIKLFACSWMQFIASARDSQFEFICTTCNLFVTKLICLHHALTSHTNTRTMSFCYRDGNINTPHSASRQLHTSGTGDNTVFLCVSGPSLQISNYPFCCF